MNCNKEIVIKDEHWSEDESDDDDNSYDPVKKHKFNVEQIEDHSNTNINQLTIEDIDSDEDLAGIQTKLRIHKNSPPKMTIKNKNQVVDEKCAICHKEFNAKPDFMIHAQRYHPNAKAFKCNLCSLTFINYNSVARHYKNHQNLVKKHVCEYCSKSFLHRDTFKRHRQIHTRDNIYNCSKCGKSYKNKMYFDNHQKTHLEDGDNSEKDSSVNHQKEDIDPVENKVEENINLIEETASLTNIDSIKQEQEEPIITADDLQTNLEMSHLVDVTKTEFLEEHQSLQVNNEGEVFKIEYLNEQRDDDEESTITHDSEPLQMLDNDMTTNNDRKTRFRKRPRRMKAVDSKCAICQREFIYRHDLLDHVEQHHPNEKAFKCNICPLTFVNILSVARHRKIHKHGSKLICQYCAKVFTLKEELNRHISNVHLVNMGIDRKISAVDKKCAICHEEFAFRRDLVKHAHKFHPEEKAFKCNVCSMVFKNISYISRHRRKHKNLPKKFACDFCPKSFRERDNFNRHLKVHFKNKGLLQNKAGNHCSVCNINFKYEISLKNHLMMHLKTKTIDGDNCENNEKNKAIEDDKDQNEDEQDQVEMMHLKTQTINDNKDQNEDKQDQIQMMHLETQTIHDDNCGNYEENKAIEGEKDKNEDQNQVQQHHQVQIQESQQTSLFPKRAVDPKCAVCKKEFLYRQDLIEHAHREHPNDRAFKCNICPRVFKNIHYLSQHRRDHKNLPKKYACRICPKRFRDRDNFTRHLRVHTGERSLSCSVCNRSYKHKASLENHEKTHLPGYMEDQLKKPAENPEPKVKKMRKPIAKCFQRPVEMKCAVCQQEFNYRFELIEHAQLNHPNEKAYKCGLCPMVFRNILQITHHRRIHKKFECKYCHKAFIVKEELKHHVRSHTKDRPFYCFLCKTTYKRRDSWVRHKKYHCQNKWTERKLDSNCLNQEDSVVEADNCLQDGVSIKEEVNNSLEDVSNIKEENILDILEFEDTSVIDAKDIIDEQILQVISNKDINTNYILENDQFEEDNFRTNDFGQIITNSVDKNNDNNDNDNENNDDEDLIFGEETIHYKKTRPKRLTAVRKKYAEHDDAIDQLIPDDEKDKANDDKDEDFVLDEQAATSDDDNDIDDGGDEDELDANDEDINDEDYLVDEYTQPKKFHSNTILSMTDDNDGPSYKSLVLAEERNEKRQVSKSMLAVDTQCGICHKEFHSSKNLTQHAIKYHRNAKAFKCKICLVLFKSINAIASHVRIHSRRIVDPKCGVCNKELASRPELIAHVNEFHPNDRAIRCALCPRLFKSVWCIAAHRRSHKNMPRKHVCKTCCTTYADLGIYKKHLKSRKHQLGLQYRERNKPKEEMYHNTTTNKTEVLDILPGKLICPYCSLILTNEEDFRRHVNTHSSTNKQLVVDKKCAACNKEFENRQDLIDHVKELHPKTKALKCSLCPSTFMHIMSLTGHRKRAHKHGPKKKYCKACQKYIAIESIRNHLKSSKHHFYVKNYTKMLAKHTLNKNVMENLTTASSDKAAEVSGASNCDFKENVFEIIDTENALEVKGELDIFKTEYVCGEAVIPKANEGDNLAEENKISQTTEYSPVNDDGFLLESSINTLEIPKDRHKSHACEICGDSFISKCHLKRHLSSHSNEQPYGCGFCTRRYKRNYDMEAHQRRVHFDLLSSLHTKKTADENEHDEADELDGADSTDLNTGNSFEEEKSDMSIASQNALKTSLEEGKGEMILPANIDGELEDGFNPKGAPQIIRKNFGDDKSDDLFLEKRNDLPTHSKRSLSTHSNDSQEITISDEGDDEEDNEEDDEDYNSDKDYNNEDYNGDEVYHNDKDYNNVEDEDSDCSFDSQKMLNDLDGEIDEISMYEPTTSMGSVDSKCAVCHQEFDSRTNLTKHAKEKHPNDNVFKCKICFLLFKTIHAIASHVRSHDRKIIDKKCGVCHEEFPGRHDLIKHAEEMHPDEKALKCALCPMVFKNLPCLSVHRKLHRNKPTKYACSTCKTTYASLDCYRSHLKSDKHQTLKEDLRRHLNKHEKADKHLIVDKTCAICNKECDRRQDLLDHVNEFHPKARALKCILCPMTFSNVVSISTHCRRVHKLGAKKLFCKLCKSYISRDSRIKHYKSKKHQFHLKITPKIISKQNLNEKYTDKDVQNDFSNFEAEDVLQIFKTKYVHDNAAIPAGENNALNFDDRSKMIENETSQNTKYSFDESNSTNAIDISQNASKIHFCEICNISFITKSKLERHLTKHSDDRPYPCNYCGKSFKLQYDLTTHQKRVHFDLINSLHKNTVDQTAEYSLEGAIREGSSLSSVINDASIISSEDSKSETTKKGNEEAKSLPNANDIKDETKSSIEHLENKLEINLEDSDNKKILQIKCNKESYVEDIQLRDKTNANASQSIAISDEENAEQDDDDADEEFIDKYFANHCNDSKLTGQTDNCSTHDSQQITITDDEDDESFIFLDNKNSQNKSHACEICGDSFISRSHLKRHQSSHTNERPYGCSFCTRRYKRKDDMRTHQRRVHFDLLSSLHTKEIAYENEHDESDELDEADSTDLNTENSFEEEKSDMSIASQNALKTSLEIRKDEMILPENIDGELEDGFNQKGAPQIIRQNFGDDKSDDLFLEKRNDLPTHSKRSLSIHGNDSQEITISDEEDDDDEEDDEDYNSDKDYSNEDYNEDKVYHDNKDCNNDEDEDSDRSFDSQKMLNDLDEEIEEIDMYEPTTSMGSVDSKCAVCHQEFDSRTNLTKHAKEKHPNDKVFKCKICFLLFKTIHAIASHVRSHDRKIIDNKCAVCHEEFPGRHDLIKHAEEMHPDEKALKCALCPMVFKNLPCLSAHRKLHRNKPTKYACSTCKTTYASLDCFRSHLKSDKHKNGLKDSLRNKSEKLHMVGETHETELQGKYTCPYCSITLTLKEDLRRHLNMHKKADKHLIVDKTCAICNKECDRRQDLLDHVNEFHPKTRALKCILCPMTFRNVVSISAHRRRVHKFGPKKFYCKLCKSYITRDALRRHYNSNKHQFNLKITPKVISKQNLNEKYTDEDVQNKFSNFEAEPEDILQMFKTKYVHDTAAIPAEANNAHNFLIIENETSQNTFDEASTNAIDISNNAFKTHFCEICNDSFISKSQLARHLTKHSEERPYSCNYCGNPFKRQYDLTTHQRRVHFDLINSLHKNTVDQTAECSLEGAISREGSSLSSVINDASIISSEDSKSKSTNKGNEEAKSLPNANDVKDETNSNIEHLENKLEISLEHSDNQKILQIESNKESDVKDIQLRDKTNANDSQSIATSDEENAEQDDDADEEFIDEYFANHCYDSKLTGQTDNYSTHDSQQITITDDEDDDESFISTKKSKKKSKSSSSMTAVDTKCAVCLQTFHCRKLLYRHAQDEHPNDNALKCNVCNLLFKSLNAIASHVRSHNRKIVDSKCGICSKEFTARHDLISHVEEFHPNERAYKCALCPRVFKSIACMSSHRRTHKNMPRKYVCEMCNKSYADLGNYKAHLRSRKHQVCVESRQTIAPAEGYKVEEILNGTFQEKHKCPCCSITLTHIDDFQRHLNTHATAKKYTAQLIVDKKCAVCQKEFTCRQDLLDHVKEFHPNAKAFKCAHCPMVFRHIVSITGHRRRVHKHEQTKIYCKLCHKHVTLDSYKTHLKSSKHKFFIDNLQKTLSANNKEELAMMNFSAISNEKDKETLLENHKQRIGSLSVCDNGNKDGIKTEDVPNEAPNVTANKDDNNFPEENVSIQNTHPADLNSKKTSQYSTFPCKICGILCPSMTLLKRHLLTHSDVRPFPCSFCNKRFKRQDDMKTHQTNFHFDILKRIKPPNSKGSNDEALKSYACHYCNYSFSSRSNMNRHLRTHSNERPFKCTYCEKAFRRSDERKMHETALHRKQILIAEQKLKAIDLVASILEGNSSTTSVQFKEPPAINLHHQQHENLTEQESIRSAADELQRDSELSKNLIEEDTTKEIICLENAPYSHKQESYSYDVLEVSKTEYVYNESMSFQINHTDESRINPIIEFPNNSPPPLESLQTETLDLNKNREENLSLYHDDPVNSYSEDLTTNLPTISHDLRMKNEIKDEHCPDIEYQDISDMEEDKSNEYDLQDKTYLEDESTTETATSMKSTTESITETPKIMKSRGKKPAMLDSKCAICHQEFDYQPKLVIHAQEKHPGEKAFKCRLCDVHFSHICSVSRHFRFHKNLPYKYVCEFCLKPFQFKDYLKFHLKIHTTDKGAFSCSLCDKSYKRKDSLISHQRSHSKTESTEGDEGSNQTQEDSTPSTSGAKSDKIGRV